MKTKIPILILSIIFLTNGFLSAQTGKGQFLIGQSYRIDIVSNGIYQSSSMNLAWSKHKLKSDTDETSPFKGFSLNLNPRVGYFFANNLAVGIDFSIMNSKSRIDDNFIIFKWFQFTTGPFIRYYVPAKTLQPYTEVNYSIGFSRDRTEVNGNENIDKYQDQTYGIGIGLGVPIGSKVTFDTLFGYYSYRYKEKEDNDNNVKNIIGTFGMKFGVTILL